MVDGIWESAKGINLLKRSKISKKSQEKEDEIQKKLYEANKWWNDWKFQLHWNKLEWLDTKLSSKLINPIQFLQKSLT